MPSHYIREGRKGRKAIYSRAGRHCPATRAGKAGKAKQLYQGRLRKPSNNTREHREGPATTGWTVKPLKQGRAQPL